MSIERIKVIAYSGYKGEEAPRRLILHDEEIEVIRIVSTWIEEGLKDRARKRFFRIEGSNGAIYKVFYDEKKGEWYL